MRRRSSALVVIVALSLVPIYLLTRGGRVAKIVICDGNSLTAGSGSTGGNTYPAQMATILGGTWTVTNKGVSGQTTAQMSADAATDIDPSYSAANAANVVVCWEGTNDIIFNADGDADDTGATTYAHLVSYCQGRRTAGFRVVIGTILPRNTFPGLSTLPGNAAAQLAHFEARRQSVNTQIRANWRTFADALADVAADSRIGDFGDDADTTYYDGSNVHLNNTGYGVVAAIVAPAVESAASPSRLALVGGGLLSSPLVR